MQLAELLNNNSSIKSESDEWQFLIKHLYIHLGIDINKFECLDCYSCDFFTRVAKGKNVITERAGYLITGTKGLLAVSPSENDLPVAVFIDKNDIRIVESEQKLFKFVLIIKTVNETYVFKVSKKYGKELEKIANKLRLNQKI